MGGLNSREGLNAHLTHDRLQLRTDTSSSSEYVRASERTLPALPKPQLLVGLRSGLVSGVDNSDPSGQGSSSGASDPGGARFSLPAPPEGTTTTSRQASSLASKLVFEAAPPESWSRRRLTRWKTPPALALRRRRLPDSGMLGFWENSHACSCSRKHVSLPADAGNGNRSGSGYRRARGHGAQAQMLASRRQVQAGGAAR